MVAQSAYYFRFDQKTWLNSDSYQIEQFVDFVKRYNISDSIVKYQSARDVDFKSETLTVIIKKQFFLNPTNDSAYANGEINDKEAFTPSANHVILIGPLSNSESAVSEESQMVLGVVQTVNEAQDTVTLTCQSMIRVLSDQQLGTDYYFNKEHQHQRYSFDENGTLSLIDFDKVRDYRSGTIWTASDEPNQPSLYYDNIEFQSEADLRINNYWNRRVSSDPAFPSMNTDSGDWYPYAVYSLEGEAASDGTIKITFNFDSSDGVTKYTTIQRDFHSGERADYILSMFNNVDPFAVMNKDPQLAIPIRISVHDNCLVVESLSNASTRPTDLTMEEIVELTKTLSGPTTLPVDSEVKDNSPLPLYLTDLKFNRQFRGKPIEITQGTGTLEWDYHYVGKAIGAESLNNVLPEDGRCAIELYTEKAKAPILPFFPLNAHGFFNVNLENGGKRRIRDIYTGYSSPLIAWRLLQDIGWCRQPFYKDMQPFSYDYTENNIPFKYSNYDTDGLYIDYVDVSYDDGTVRNVNSFLNSFDCAKQSFATNMKTLADNQGMFLNATFTPKIENHIPVWDDTVYNSPSYALFEFTGCLVDSSVDITIKFPMIDTYGNIYQESVLVSGIFRLTTKQIAARVAKEITTQVPTFTKYYNIFRRGSIVYIETPNLDIAEALTNNSTYYNFDAVISTSVGTIVPLYALMKKHIQQIDEHQRQAEKVYNLRRWGIFPGFHPKVFIRNSPNNMNIKPSPDRSLQYGGTGARTDTTDSSIVGKPTWTSDTKDMINKVIVQYSSSDVANSSNTYIVFPGKTKQYRYFALHLNGLVSVNTTNKATLGIYINLHNKQYHGYLEVPVNVNDTSSIVVNYFNQTLLKVQLDEVVETGTDTLYFPVASNGDSIFILTDVSTTNLFTSTSQVYFKLNAPDGLVNDVKELVYEEPPEFDLARDSQAKYGIKQMSLTLPETKSINDTMNFIANIFKKYMEPKDRVVCDMTDTDGWHLPLFTYSEVTDYTSYTTEQDELPWYATATFQGKTQVDQNVHLVFTYDDGSYERLKIPISKGDGPEDIARKIGDMAISGELANYDVTVEGKLVSLVPKITYGSETPTLYPSNQFTRTIQYDENIYDSGGYYSGNTGSSGATGESGSTGSSGGSGTGTYSKITVLSTGALIDGNGTAIPVLKGVNDSASLIGWVGARGAAYAPCSTASCPVQHPSGNTTAIPSTPSEIAAFFFRYGKALLSQGFNYIRIGAHDDFGTDRLITTWNYDQANGTNYTKNVLVAMCQGLEASGIYFTIGPLAGFSNMDASGHQLHFDRKLSASMTALNSYYNQDDKTYNSTSYTDQICYDGSPSHDLFCKFAAWVCDQIGNFSHLVGVELYNEPDLGIHKQYFWGRYKSTGFDASSISFTYSPYQQLASGSWTPSSDWTTGTAPYPNTKPWNAFRNWMVNSCMKIRQYRSVSCLLTSGETPYDGGGPPGTWPFWYGIQYRGSGTTPSDSDWAGLTNCVVGLAGSLDIVGVHQYTFAFNWLDNWNSSITESMVSSGYYCSGTTQQSTVHMKTISEKVVAAAGAAGKAALNTEWGQYCAAWQVYVESQQQDFINAKFNAACIVPISRSLINLSLTLPSNWQNLPIASGTGTTTGGGGSTSGTSGTSPVSYTYKIVRSGTTYATYDDGGVQKHTSTGDVSTEINWAISQSSSGQVIYLPADTYQATANINISGGLTLTGDIDFSTNNPKTTINGNGAPTLIRNGTTSPHAQNISIKNLNMTGSIQIKFSGDANATRSTYLFQDIYALNTPSNCGASYEFDLVGANSIVSGLIFRRCRADHPNTYGFRIKGDGSNISTQSANNVTFDSCQALYAGVNGRPTGNTYIYGFHLGDDCNCNTMSVLNCVANDNLECGYYFDYATTKTSFSMTGCTASYNGTHKTGWVLGYGFCRGKHDDVTSPGTGLTGIGNANTLSDHPTQQTG